MACSITINNKTYTEKQFKNLLKTGLLYESLERGLVTLPVETTVITKPATPITALRGNFPLKKEDIVLSMKNVFGLDTKKANASAAIIDRMANSWAKRNNKTVEDFYKTIVFIKPATPKLEDSKNLLYSQQEIVAIEREKKQVREDYKSELFKAPNGKPTNLTEDQWLTVRTPTFKAWFGNWESGQGSKALDENGEPKVYYHGSDSAWTVFDPEIAKSKSAFPTGALFVSPEIEFSEGYVKTPNGKITEFFIKANNPFDYENQTHLDLLKASSPNLFRQLSENQDENWRVIELPLFQDFLKENNFDGFYVSEWGVKNLATFDPASAKVSDGRNQTFLQSNPNILFQQDPSRAIAAVVKGFDLVYNPKGFGRAYNTKNGKATPALANRINTWLAQNNLSGVKFYYEKLYGTINAIIQPQPNMLFQTAYTDTYVIQEEGNKLARQGNTNFFKEDPTNPWGKSALRDSVQVIELSDIETTETPSEDRISKYGEYKKPEYNEYSTGFPIAIQYKGRIILLDGHHRVEMAKRAGEKDIQIAIKNVDNIYGTQSNLLFQMIGDKGASNLNLDSQRSLKAAQYMQMDGYSSEDIFFATGWEKGVDGQWRTEIDKNVKWKNNTEALVDGARLDDVIDYPTLFKAYPQLKDLTVQLKKSRTIKGSLYANAGKSGFEALSIFAQAPTSDELMGVLVHELQHAIQTIEGFSIGAVNGGLTNDQYIRTASEVEARNATKRLFMALDNQTLNVPFSKTEDVRRGDQIAYNNISGKLIIVRSAPNLLFQIIGEKGASRLNNKLIIENLDIARAMEMEGKSARDIRYATGWERGADKKWKYEILDGNVIPEGIKKLSDNKINLSEIYDNPKLYEAYPVLKTIKVNSINTPDGNAQFDPASRTIEISNETSSPEVIRTILLHEIQHAIQSIEGFANGGSVTTKWAAITNIENDFKNAISEDNWKQLFNSEEELLQSIVKKYFKDEGVVYSPASPPPFPGAKAKGIWIGVKTGKVTRMFGRDIQEYIKYPNGWDFYMVIKGEVEARNVTTRANMSEEQRKEQMLVDTEDVARESQVYIDLGDTSGLYEETPLINSVFQSDYLNQQAQAAILLGQDAADIIYALTDPNVSSPLHEMAHKWERELTEEEVSKVLAFAKENNIDISNGWTREVSEAFARGFEKYLAEGIAPTPALEKLFKQFAEWLTEIYKGIVGSEIDIELNNDMRKIYAAMLGAEFETTVKEEVAQEQAAPAIEASAPVEEVNTISLEAYREYINLLSEDTIDLLYDEVPMNLLPDTSDVTLDDRKSTIYGAYYRAKPLNNSKYDSFINLVEQAVEQSSGITQPSVSTEVVEIVLDAVDWKSPITYETQDIEAKKQAIIEAYDNKAFDEAVMNGSMSIKEVEEILTSAGLPAEAVDKIMFRTSEQAAMYSVKGLLNMKVNAIFQQVANYFIDNGMIEAALKNDEIDIEQAKQLLDKVIPDFDSKNYEDLKRSVNEKYETILKNERDRIENERLKRKGFSIGDAIEHKGNKYIIIDEYMSGKNVFKGFVVINPIDNKKITVEVGQFSEWTEEAERIFQANLKINQLKEQLGEVAPKPVEKKEEIPTKKDNTHPNLRWIPFDKVKDKGVEAANYAQILNIARKFVAMFPSIEMVITYLEDNTKGSISGNKVLINLKNATQDTPVHELMHPFVLILKNENKRLYNNLMNEFKNNKTVYNVYMEEVQSNFYYSAESLAVQEEEAFVQYLGETIASLHDSKGNFIEPEVLIDKLYNKRKEQDFDSIEDDLTDLSEEELDKRLLAEFEDLTSDEGIIDKKTQSYYESLGYEVVGEVESSRGVEGRVFKSIKMVHPKVQAITSSFMNNFYNWFTDLLKSLGIKKSKGGVKKGRFSDFNLAIYRPDIESVEFYKPAKNRAERVEKKEILDEEGNVIETKTIRKSKEDRASFKVKLDNITEELKSRGASESEISDLMAQIEGHTNEKAKLKISLENSYVPSDDNLSKSISSKLDDGASMFNMSRQNIELSELPVNMTINDLATMLSYGGNKLAFDFEPYVDALSQLEAYQYTNSDVARDLIARTEKRVKVLAASDARIGLESSPTIRNEAFAVKELLYKYKDVQFIEAYVRQGIGALADAAKMIKYIKESINDGEAKDEVMNQTLNRDLREAQSLISFYDDVASLIEKNQQMFNQEDLDYFNMIMTRATSRRREINSIMVDLITEWLYPTIGASQKNLTEKERLTKEEFKKNVRAATSDVDFISYWGQAPVNSKDPLMAALAIKIKDELNKNYTEEANNLQKLRVLYDEFLKSTGIANTAKAVEDYYKANFLRKAKVWELVSIDKDGTKKYDYVERWAFHEEYLADVHAEQRRQEIERLKKQLGEPNSYDERLAFNERVSAWDAANPLQSAKFRNPAFAALKNNEYYMFLYDTYRKANDKYADRRLNFGIIPQAYNSPNALQKAQRVAKYVRDVAKGDASAAQKLKELGVSAANAVFDKNSFEKIQALNLDGSYHMSVKSPFTHLLDEDVLSFKLNESVYGFSTSANAYNTLRNNQANIENLKLLINGNVKLGVEARKVLKTQIKTKNGVTGPQMVWDVIEGMPPQDKEQSAKKITKQMNAYINDVFYGVSEVGGEFNIGPIVINTNKIADNLGFATALLNMAGNVLAGLSNVTIGNVMSLGESMGGKYYSPKDWLAGQKIYMGELLSGKFLADAIDPVKSKITQLGIMHDAIQGEFRDKYGKNITGNVLQRYFTKDTLFIINHIAEHQIQLTGMLSLMNATKVKLKDGSEVTLYEAYVKNDKGFYKLREDAIWSDKQQQDFIRTLHGISRDLNGNYAAYDKSMLQRYALGKLILQYRKYLYTAWRTRFGSRRFDYEKGTIQEGYYRAFLKALYADIKEFNLNSLVRTLVDPKLNSTTLTDEQKYAIRKTRFDIAMIVGLTMLSSMLAAAEAEAGDDDEYKWILQILLLWALRLRSDLSSYSITLPQELHRMATNPSASFNTITKFLELLGQVSSDIQNGEFETYQRRTGNNEAGDLKVVGKFEKLLPVYRQWLKLQSPEDQLKYYDLINKNVKPSDK